jgi:hypothetical protein
MMTKKSNSPRKVEAMYSDPVPDPYPEMDDEVFEMFQAQGLTPDDMADPESKQEYAQWLEAHPVAE